MDKEGDCGLKRKLEPCGGEFWKRRKVEIASWEGIPCFSTLENHKLPAVFDHIGPTIVVKSTFPETPLPTFSSPSPPSPSISLESQENWDELNTLKSKVRELEGKIDDLEGKWRQVEQYEVELNRLIGLVKGPVAIICKIVEGEKREKTLNVRYPERTGRSWGEIRTIEVEGNRKVYALTCDRVLPPNSTSDDLLAHLKSDIQAVLTGVSLTVVIHGPASPGKSELIEGKKLSLDFNSDSGLFHGSLMTLFSCKLPSHQVHISCICLCTDTITDLLNPSLPALNFKPSTHKTVLEQQIWKRVMSPSHGISIYETAKNRRFEGRFSHYVTDIMVTGGGNSDGRLVFVDLAGTDTECKYVNMGLFCLQKVMRMKRKSENSVIPYRENKLTRVLQPAISTGKVALIVTIVNEEKRSKEARRVIKYACEVQRPVA